MNQVLEHRDQAVTALQGEALLPHVTGVQVAFDALRAGQLLENLQALLVAQRRRGHLVLEVLAQPETFARTRDVSKFHGRLAAVNRPQQRDDVAQFHARVAGTGEAARVELGVHIGLGQAEVVELEDAGNAPLHQAERIEIGDLVTAKAVYLDEARHGSLLLGRGRGRFAACRPELPGPAAVARRLEQLFANPGMGDLGARIAERLEIFAPDRRNRVGIAQILLVQCLDRAGIAAEERCRCVLVLERTAHETGISGDDCPVSTRLFVQAAKKAR